MFNIIAWILFGGLAGWIASLAMHTNKKQGAIENIIVGIVGSLIGGFVVRAIGGSGFTGFNLYSLLVAVLGAMILLWLVGRLQGGHTHHR